MNNIIIVRNNIAHRPTFCKFFLFLLGMLTMIFLFITYARNSSNVEINYYGQILSLMSYTLIISVFGCNISNESQYKMILLILLHNITRIVLDFSSENQSILTYGNICMVMLCLYYGFKILMNHI